MRNFIRHPADIPIRVGATQQHRAVPDEACEQQLNNIGQGGLSFNSEVPIEPGTTINITIDVSKPPFKAKAVAVWCQQRNGHYDVGVKFDDGDTEFDVRMVEQVCHIIHYWREELRKKRKLTIEEAAQEWIGLNGAEFPR